MAARARESNAPGLGPPHSVPGGDDSIQEPSRSSQGKSARTMHYLNSTLMILCKQNVAHVSNVASARLDANLLQA